MYTTGLNDEIDGKMQTRLSHKIKKGPSLRLGPSSLFHSQGDGVVLENGIGFHDHFNVGYAAIFGSFDG